MGLFSDAKEKISFELYYRADISDNANFAFKCFLKAAELGEIRSNFQLAKFYCLGRGVETDWKKADYWIQKSFEKQPNYSTQKERIAKILSEISNICKEKEQFEQVYTWIDKTFRWYTKDELSYRILWKAMVNLAERANKQEIVVDGFYKYGMIPYQKKAFKDMKILFEGAAKYGDARAQYQYGQLYEKGHYFDEDKKAALEWYEKAANSGLADAQYQCGVMYQKGLGTDANIETALQWYEKAGEQGHKEAQSYLMEYYGFNDKALYWAKKASDNGVKDAERLYKDIQKIMAFNSAMELYNAGKYAEALPLLEKGPGVGADWRYAYFLSAQMYRKGIGTDIDNKKAIQFYAKAVQIAGFSGDLELERKIEKLEDVGEALLLFAQYSYSLGKYADSQTLPAMEDAAAYGYIVAFLRLAVLYQRNGEPEKAADSFKIWLNSIDPGETYSFGSFPQSEKFYASSEAISHVKRDPVYWDVLHVEEDRALLLCRSGLLFNGCVYGFEKCGGLFSEEEQPFVLEEYMLTKEEAQEYILDKKYAPPGAQSTFYARTMYAWVHDLEIQKDYQNGGYKVGFSSEGMDQFKKDQARKSGDMSTVANGSDIWVACNGFVCSGLGKLQPWEKYASDSIVERPAFWFGIKKSEK